MKSHLHRPDNGPTTTTPSASTDNTANNAVVDNSVMIGGLPDVDPDGGDLGILDLAVEELDGTALGTGTSVTVATADPDDPDDGGGTASDPDAGHGLINDSQAITRVRSVVGNETRFQDDGGVVPNGTPVIWGDVESGRLVTKSGKSKKVAEVVEVTWYESGQAHTAWTTTSNLKGAKPLSADAWAALVAGRTTTNGVSVDFLEGTTKAPSVDQQDEDAVIQGFRDQRREQLADDDAIQGTDGSLLQTVTGSWQAADPLYLGPLTLQQSLYVPLIVQMVHDTANTSTFAEPGQAAPDAPETLTAGHLITLETHLANRFGAGALMEQYVEEAHTFWEPQTVKYADGADHTGISGLFARKNDEWKALRRNERRQRVQEWGVVEFFHSVFKWKLNTGPTLTEVTWLVEAHDDLLGIVQSTIASITADDPFALYANGAPTSLAAVSPAPMPAVPEVDSVEDMAAALTPHNEFAGGGPITVTTSQIGEGRKAEIDKALLEILPAIDAYGDVGSDARTLAGEMGLEADWASPILEEPEPAVDDGDGADFDLYTYEIDERYLDRDLVTEDLVHDGVELDLSDQVANDPAYDWSLDDRSLDEILDGGPPEIVGFVTITQVPALLELDMGVFTSPEAGATEIMAVFPGDRLATTGTIQAVSGVDWLQVQTRAGALGWVQASLTNGADVLATVEQQQQATADLEQQQLIDQVSVEGPTATDPDAPVSAPAGLEVRAYHVLKRVAPTEVYQDVYSDATAGQAPVSADATAHWELLAETGPGDSRRAEILYDGWPAYIPRDAIRPATRLDLMMNLDRITADDLREAREDLAGGDAVLAGEPERVAAYYVRLNEIGPLLAKDDNATGLGVRASLVETIASAFQHLCIPNPYPQQRYADAIEMVRLEQGLPRKLEAADWAVLATAFGVTASEVDATSVLDELQAGRAVIVYGPTGWRRVRGVADGALTGENVDNGNLEAIDGATVTSAITFAVPADIDGDLDALAQLQTDAGTALTADETSALYREQIYPTTYNRESSWYLAHLAGENDPGGRSGAHDDLKDWVPAADDAGLFVAGPEEKFFHAVGSILDKGAAADEGADPNFDAVPPGYADARAFIEAFALSLPSDDERWETLPTVVELIQDHLREALVRRFDPDAPAVGVDFIAWADAEPLLLEAPVAAESLRDVLKNELVTVPAGAGGGAVPLGGDVTITASSFECDETGASLEDGHPALGDTITIDVGGFALTLTWGTSDYGTGWYTAGTAPVLINGEEPNVWLSDDQLAALGLSPSEIEWVRVTEQVEGGGGAVFGVNAYDQAYVSIGFNQFIGMSEVEDYGGLMPNMIGNATHEIVGGEAVVRDGMQVVVDTLESVGISLVLLSAAGDHSRYTFSVEDEVLGTCGPQEAITAEDLTLLQAAGRPVPQVDGSGNSKQLFHQDLNRSLLAIRSHPVRIAVLTSVFQDPRIMAANALQWKNLYANSVESMSVGDHALTEYGMSEKLFGALTYVANGGSGVSKITDVFTALEVKNPGISDPSKWAAQRTQFEAAMLTYVRNNFHNMDNWLDHAGDLSTTETPDLGDHSGVDLAYADLSNVTDLDLTATEGEPVTVPMDATPWERFQAVLQVDMSAVVAVPITAVYGEDLREQMAEHVQDTDAMGLLEKANTVLYQRLYLGTTTDNDGVVDRVAHWLGLGPASQEREVLLPFTLPATTDLFELAWYGKRFAEEAGWTETADAFDAWFLQLEKKAGHTRVWSSSGGWDVPDMGDAALDYDEEAAMAYMDAMYEAYTNIPVQVEVNGALVTVNVRTRYRNFVDNEDYLGAVDYWGATHKWFKRSALTDGEGTDGVNHSMDFALAYQGKATPLEMQVAIEEAIDNDSELSTKLEGAKTEDDAENILNDWMQRRLGLDCIGFAWNLVNGSMMYEDFVATTTYDGKDYDWKTHQEKMDNISASGFLTSGKDITDDPGQWRALDCMVDSGHIIVIYQATELDDGTWSVETMESYGSDGVNRVTYVWGTDKIWRYPSEKKVGHDYKVIRPTND